MTNRILILITKILIRIVIFCLSASQIMVILRVVAVYLHLYKLMIIFVQHNVFTADIHYVRFSLGLSSRATKCAVCQSSVMFGKQAAKCQECRVVTHEKCRSELPATCGLPTQYIQLYQSEVLQKRSINSAGGVLEADLQLVELGGWMKARG